MHQCKKLWSQQPLNMEFKCFNWRLFKIFRGCRPSHRDTMESSQACVHAADNFATEEITNNCYNHVSFSSAENVQNAEKACWWLIPLLTPNSAVLVVSPITKYPTPLFVKISWLPVFMSDCFCERIEQMFFFNWHHNFADSVFMFWVGLIEWWIRYKRFV